MNACASARWDLTRLNVDTFCIECRDLDAVSVALGAGYRLPVVIVDDWAEVTQQLLQDRSGRTIHATYGFSSLFLHHSRSGFIGASPDRTFDNLTIDGFRNLFC